MTDDLNIPDNVTLLEDYGQESVWSDDHCVAEGKVVYVSAEPEALVSWLDGREIWVGNGMVGFHKEKVVAGPGCNKV
jgi:hypothetical protein